MGVRLCILLGLLTSKKVYPAGTPYDKSSGLSVKVYPTGTPYDKSFGLSVKVCRRRQYELLAGYTWKLRHHNPESDIFYLDVPDSLDRKSVV